MKILISVATFSSGGAERVLSILSASFASYYEEVIYLSWIDVPDFYEIDSRIKRVCVERESKSKNKLIQSLWFRQYIKKEKPNIILSFLAPFNVLVCYSLLGVDVPIIVCERNDPRCVWNGFIQRNARKLAYRKAAGILEQTESNKNYFSGKLLNKTDVIYNPIIMSEDYLGKALRTEKRDRIVSVVRLEKQKNIEMLLRAFCSLSKKNPNYTLTIYGNGSYKEHLQEIIKKYQLDDKVNLPGAVSDVWDAISDAKCFVLPSWYEGMPNALLEAMCLGLPCVSTKVSGAVDFIKSEDNGVLVDLDDDIALSAEMNRIIEDRDFAVTLGKNATSLYNLLNIDDISKQWLNYIDSKIK